MYRVKENQWRHPCSILLFTCSSRSLQHFHCYLSGENNGRGKLISWIICCVTQPSACCCYRLMGPGAGTPRGVTGGWRTAVESASNHRNPNATAHFHGLAEKQLSKQENHTLALWSVPVSLKSPNWRFPSKLPRGKWGKDCPESKRWRKKRIRCFWGQKNTVGEMSSAEPVIWCLSCFVLAAE